MIGAADEAVVAVAAVEHHGGRQRVDMIEHRRLGVEPELGPNEGVVEIVVVGAVPGIGAVADEETLAVA